MSTCVDFQAATVSSHHALGQSRQQDAIMLQCLTQSWLLNMFTRVFSFPSPLCLLGSEASRLQKARGRVGFGTRTNDLLCCPRTERERESEGLR